MSKKDSYQVSLKLILKNEKGEILILRDRDDGTFGGFYDLPGGRIDTDEFSVDFRDIVLRELKEETGNTQAIINKEPVALARHQFRKLDEQGRPVRVLYVFFTGQYLSGDIVISEEHTDYQWIDLENIELEKYFTSGILEGIQIYLNKNSR